jgi:hypothetical protein
VEFGPDVLPSAFLNRSALAVRKGENASGPAVTVAGVESFYNSTIDFGTVPGTIADFGDVISFTNCSSTAFTNLASVAFRFAEGSVLPPGKIYTLISGANLQPSDKDRFSLPEGVLGSIDVVDGNLVYIAPAHFYIRITEDSSGELEVPFGWIYENTTIDGASSADDIESALSANGANGIPVWQSYCLGLNPKDAQSVVLCAAAAEQPPEAGNVAIEIPRSSVPAELSGVAVTAYLDVKTPGSDWVMDTTGVKISSGAISRIATVSDGISFFA